MHAILFSALTVHFILSFVMAENRVQEKFKSDEVSKDLGIEIPKRTFKVKFGNTKVDLGNEIDKQTAGVQPSSLDWDADPNKYYSVILVDPDATSRRNPQFREWRHWVVVNVKGSDISQGTVLTPYKGPSPPTGTGLHRYVFLAYEQPSGKAAFEHLEESRASWKVQKFASKHGLRLIAGNYFQAQTP